MNITKLVLRKLFLFSFFWLYLVILADATKSHTSILLFFVLFLTWLATETTRTQIKIKSVLQLVAKIQKKEYEFDLGKYVNVVRFTLVFAAIFISFNSVWNGVRPFLYKTTDKSITEGAFILLTSYMLAQHNELHRYYKKCYENGKQLFIKMKEEENLT